MLIPGVTDVCEGEGTRLVSCVTQTFSKCDCVFLSTYKYVYVLLCVFVNQTW